MSRDSVEIPKRWSEAASIGFLADTLADWVNGKDPLEVATALNQLASRLMPQADHGNLTGLADDDHSQYALLAGRATGQTLKGGTGSAENLTLQGTSHATPGLVLIPVLNGLVIGHISQIDFGAIPKFQVLGTGTADASMGFARFEDNAAGPDVRFLKSRGNTVGANTIVQDGDKLGRFRFQGADGGDFNTTAAEVSAEVDGTPALNDIPGRLIFTTRAKAGSLSERMRLANNGNFGINTTNPAEKLDVDGNIAVSGTVDGRDVAADGVELDGIQAKIRRYAVAL